MRRGAFIALSLCLVATVARANDDAEAELVLLGLRDGERPKLEAKLGAATLLPLYRAELRVDPAKRTVKGVVKLRYLPPVATSALFLRVTPNAFEGAPVQISAVALSGTPLQVERPEPSLLRLPLPNEAGPNEPLHLSFELSAKIPRGPVRQAGMMGLLKASSGGSASEHGGFLGDEDFVSLVGVLPSLSVERAPGKPTDGPGPLGDLGLFAPAHFLVSVVVPKGFVVHAPGEPLGEVPEREAETRFSFAAAAVREFPVFLSRGYSRVEKSLDGMQLEVSFAPEHQEGGERVLAELQAGVQVLEKKLGRLPQKRLKVVETPLFDGLAGRDFQGLILVPSSFLGLTEDPLASLGLGSLASKMPGLGLQLPDFRSLIEGGLDFAVAHGLSHQYFAGLVGSDPVEDPVVDEGLAQFTTVLLTEWRKGRKAARVQTQEELVGMFHLFRMGGGKDAAAHRPTGDFDSPLEYGALVLGKAPLLHRQQRQLLGDNTFEKALRTYVDEYRYRTATAESFEEVLTRAVPVRGPALQALRARYWDEAHGDEDLGKPAVKALSGSLGGMPMDAETQRLLEQLLQGLGGP